MSRYVTTTHCRNWISTQCNEHDWARHDNALTLTTCFSRMESLDIPRLSFLSFSAVLEAKTPCYEVTEEEFERHSNVSIVAICIKLWKANRLTSVYLIYLDLWTANFCIYAISKVQWSIEQCVGAYRTQRYSMQLYLQEISWVFRPPTKCWTCLLHKYLPRDGIAQKGKLQGKCGASNVASI